LKGLVYKQENNSFDSPSPAASATRQYALIKWLENSQFDFNNELLGRMTSVPHTNIIDYEPEDLKAGMVISVFRNSGEIWRAQVVVPKTTLSGADLSPESDQKLNVRNSLSLHDVKLSLLYLRIIPN
jgi:hypothetical protein